MISSRLLNRSHWIFDMDGTLTVAAHDFDAIRADLGLPTGEPILESLSRLPASRSELLVARLDEIELEIALRAEPQNHAFGLLKTLADAGAKLGIVTRNSRRNVVHTLRTTGLSEFFVTDHIVDRDDAMPKPSPAGVNRLLGIWDASPDDTVVVGDYVFDMVAGREAGAATILVDGSGTFEHAAYADETIEDLGSLLVALTERLTDY